MTEPGLQYTACYLKFFFSLSFFFSFFVFTSFSLNTATLSSCLNFLQFLFGGVYLRICGEYGWVLFFPPFTMGGTLLNDMISFVCLRNGLDKASMRSQRQLSCTCESDWEAISLSNARLRPHQHQWIWV